MPETTVARKQDKSLPTTEPETSTDTIEDPLARLEMSDPMLESMAVDTAPQPSIRVEGSGALQGMFITEGMKQFPGSWFDGSDQTEAFRQSEVDLGESGVLDDEGTELAKRIAENLKNPRTTDITVRFSEGESGTEVTITGPKGSETLSFDMDSAESMGEIDAFVQQLLDAMKVQTSDTEPVS